MARVLITCTQPRADDYVTDLVSRGVHAIASPALEKIPLIDPMPSGPFDGIVITSRHALDVDLPNLPTVVVGQETARLASEKGLCVVQTGDGGIMNLDLSSYRSIFYPCAQNPTYIPDHATVWPVYDTRANPAFAIGETIDTVCVFSVKAAQIVKSQDLESKTVLCFSEAIAKEFDKIPLQNLAVSSQPRYDAMTSLILNHTKEVK